MVRTKKQGKNQTHVSVVQRNRRLTDFRILEPRISLIGADYEAKKLVVIRVISG